MPTYVYKFVKTGETIEVQQSFDDAALTQAVHPRSGRKMAVKKVFTPVGVTFKGGGFYKTDSRGKSSSASTSSTTSTTPLVERRFRLVDIDIVGHVEPSSRQTPRRARRSRRTPRRARRPDVAASHPAVISPT